MPMLQDLRIDLAKWSQSEQQQLLKALPMCSVKDSSRDFWIRNLKKSHKAPLETFVPLPEER